MTYFIFAFTWYLITVVAMMLDCGKVVATVLQVITLIMAIIAVINFFTLWNPLNLVLR